MPTLSLFLFLGGASVAVAQDPSETRGREVVAALDSLPPQARVLLSSGEVGSREAVFLGVREDSLEVVFARGSTHSTVPLLELDSAWLAVRTPGRLWLGAGIGAAAGAALIAGGATYSCGFSDGHCTVRNVTMPGLAFTAGGAAAGAAAGLLFDHIWPRWRLLFPAAEADRPER